MVMKRGLKEKAVSMRQLSGSSVQKSTESTPTGDPDSVYRSDEEPGISSDEEFAPQDIFDEWMV